MPMTIDAKRPFSIYLLKEGFDADNALSDDNKLSDPVAAKHLPPHSTLHLFDGPSRQPWWRTYLGVSEKLQQATKAALMFVMVKERTYAVCFGNTAHNLRDESFEYDFGLRITLNSVDPDKLRNIDVAEPSTSRRQRTQTAVGSDLTFFDFESDSKVLRSLTGAVRSEYAPTLRNVTGSSNVRFTSSVKTQDIPQLCQDLLEIYNKTDFLENFPDVQNVTPVRDPDVVTELDAGLVDSLKQRSLEVLLTIPEIVDYSDPIMFRFTGEGPSLLYPDIYTAQYYEYLAGRDFDFDRLSRDTLGRQRVEILTEDEVKRNAYPIYKCLVADGKVAGDQAIYHLMEGNWYRFEEAYVSRLDSLLSPLIFQTSLPSCEQYEEKDYNLAAAKVVPSGLCLDRKNISPTGNSQVEPCDVLFEDAGTVVLAHVKMSTASAELSHLFNQGANSFELIKTSPEAQAKLLNLVSDLAASPAEAIALRDGIIAKKMRVEYVVVTHKPPTGGVQNLPLFSRISLARVSRLLRAMDANPRLCFVENKAEDRPGTAKQRKLRRSSS